MDEEHWIRIILGAGASLLVALVTAVARWIMKRGAPRSKQPHATESTDVLTLKIERHSETRQAQEEEGEHDAAAEREARARKAAGDHPRRGGT